MYNRRVKIALLATPGGHFEQLTNLSDFYNNYEHFWITKKNIQTESSLKGKKKYHLNIAHFTTPWLYIPHFPKIIKIFGIEKPTHIVSTGSGSICLAPFLISKILKIKFIYIETFSRVDNYTNFASFLKKIKHPILSQWKSDTSSNIAYIGPVFKKEKTYYKSDLSKDFIFVTLGTRTEPFYRLIESIEILVKKGFIKDTVIVQAGHTRYYSNDLKIFDFCSVQKIDEFLRNAKFVITQESAGIGSKCLKCNKRFIVMPRNYKYGELDTKSDMREDLHYKLEELGYTKVINNTNELELAIKSIDKLKTGFKFNNSLAISTLRDLMKR